MRSGEDARVKPKGGLLPVITDEEWRVVGGRILADHYKREVQRAKDEEEVKKL